MKRSTFFKNVTIACIAALWSVLATAAAAPSDNGDDAHRPTSAFSNSGMPKQSFKICPVKNDSGKSQKYIASPNKLMDWCDHYCCWVENGVKYCRVDCTCA